MDKMEQSCSNYGLMMENCYNFNPNWSDSNDPNDPFESALSSMVSSPSTTPILSSSNRQGTMITELIGRLGSIVDSTRETDGNNNSSTTTPTTNTNTNTNNNTSCYNTPLNSPPLSKYNLTSLMISANYPPNLGSLNDDFVERAAKFSCFGNAGHNNNNNNYNNYNENIISGKLSRVNSEKKLINNNNISNNNGESRESSSLSEQNPGIEFQCKPQNDAISRKRKSFPKTKLKDNKIENEESDAKRSKVDNESNKKKTGGECNNNKVKDNKNNTTSNTDNDNNNNNNNDNKAEPPKDYIHVRARRGQATDSHSLAERVRREKISERMKFLQDLVPGCNKVTGKATVLDEIINYVQSLQRQVEFLSMKLSTVNPRAEFNMNALLSKTMFQSRGSQMYQIDQNSAQEFPFVYQSNQQIPTPYQNGAPNGFENPFSLNPMNGSGIGRDPNVPTPSINGLVGSLPQLPTVWEDDLQSIVQMGIVPNETQSVAGTLLTNANFKMKLEL